MRSIFSMKKAINSFIILTLSLFCIPAMGAKGEYENFASRNLPTACQRHHEMRMEMETAKLSKKRLGEDFGVSDYNNIAMQVLNAKIEGLAQKETEWGDFLENLYFLYIDDQITLPELREKEREYLYALSLWRNRFEAELQQIKSKTPDQIKQEAEEQEKHEMEGAGLVILIILAILIAIFLPGIGIGIDIVLILIYFFLQWLGWVD